MKKYSVYALSLFLLLTPTVYTQDSFLSLGQELTKINDNQISESLNTTFKKQDAGSIEEVEKELVLLQISNEEVKNHLKKNHIDKLNCNSPSFVDSPKKPSPEQKKGGWEVVLLVQASSERNDIDQEVTHSTEKVRTEYFELLLAPDENALKETFNSQIASMSEEEVLKYIAFIGSRLPYNIERSEFKQDQNQKGLNLFDILQDEMKFHRDEVEIGAFGGICGDIHYALGELVNMANKQGKTNCDYFMMSYTTMGAGHVIGGCAKENGEFLVLNYGETRFIKDPNGVSGLQPGIGNSAMPDIGSRIRIFEHTEDGSNHKATLKNELGSFLYSMNLKKEHHMSTPLYEDFSSFGAEINHNSEKVSLSKKGKEITKEINQGLRFYTGRLQNSQEVFGVAVYRESSKKKGSFTSSSTNVLSANKADSKHFDDQKGPLNLYFLHHYGIQTPIIQKDGFRLMGEISEQVELNYYFVPERPNTVDGDFNLKAKVSAQKRLGDKTNISSSVAVDHAIGIKDQRNMYNFSELPENVKLTTNAIKVDAKVSHRLDNNRTIAAQGNFVTTKVGSKYDVITSYASGSQHIYVKYENSGKGHFTPFTMNLLPNARQGVETGLGTTLQAGNKTIETSGKLRYDFDHGFFIGAGIKLKLNKK